MTIAAFATGGAGNQGTASNVILPGPVWYADEGARVATVLPLHESPVVLALNDRGIQWTLAGVFSGSKRMQGVLSAWAKAPITPRTTNSAPPVAP